MNINVALRCSKRISSVAMAGDTEAEIPETGAVFTFGKSKFADNIPSKFWLKNDAPSKLACGDEHTALITEKGKLFMFGSNNWGQLGLGEKISVSVPTCVKALKSEKVKLVACGRTHTLVYTSCGNLYAAGGNNEGQLGLGDFGERTSFQLVDFFTKRGPIKTLAAGSNTSAAITQDGKLYVWGDNSEGQIGLGKEEGTATPRELNVGRRVTWVSCGYYHSAFVTEDGALFTFGERDSGKLGLSTAQLSDHKAPQRVEGIGERVLQVACGGSHTLALTEKHLYSFGLGQFGQLGHGTFTFESHLPRAVEHFRRGRVKHIECGENHSAVLTERGLLYTFGDGRHGKLALGEEYFANQFKPTLCPRFLEYNVQAVTCGGCHTIVLAKPRLPKSEDVILEEDDVTEDHLEKLLREAESRHGLNRSLSARDRRRERKRSPEQFGMMFRTLPPLSSAHRNASVPVSSQTFPSQTSKKTTNGFQTNGLHSSTDKVTGEHEVHGKTAVENYEDDESVKDLGETADLLNLTHVMKMHPAEKTITFSPVQKKKVKAGERHSKVVKQLIHDPEWAGLGSGQAPSSDLRTSHVGKSEFGEPRCRSDRRNAVKESRLVRGPASGRRDKSESRPKSKPKPQRQVIDIEPKSKAQIDHEVTVKGAETETEKEVYESEGFRRDDLDSTGSKARPVDKRWRRATEEKKPREVSARVTRTKTLLRTESASKVKAKHEATAVQSKTQDNTRETWGGSSSSEQSYQAQRTQKTQSTKPERNLDTQKKRLGAGGSSDSVRSGSIAGVASLTEDLPIESPERLLEDVLSSQFLSRTREQSPNTVDERTLSISEDPEKTASKRTAVTITVKPVPAASDEETEKSMSQCQSEDKMDDKGGESGRGRIDQVESVGRDDHEERDEESKTEPEEESSSHVMEERENAEVGKTQQDEVESRMSEEEGSKEMDGRIESQSSNSEGEKGSSKSENVCDTKDDCSEGDKSEDESEEEEAGEEDSSEEESVSVRNEKTEEESGKESETEEDMTGGRSGKEEQESGTEGKDSEGEEKEMESEDGEESDSGKDESKEEEEESEASVEEEEESNTGCEEESEAGKAESEEEEGESGGNEERSEKEEGEEEEEESEAGNEESEGEEEESEAGNEESEGEEEESEAGMEESEEEEEESETGMEESGEEEEESGEEEESEEGMEESGEEEEESGEEEEESEAGMEESGEEQEESGENQEESGEEQEESEAGMEESGEEEEESEAGMEESGEEEEKSESGMEESGEEEEKSETGMEESGEPEEESGEEEEGIEREAVNEEDDSVEKESDDEEEGKDDAGNEGVEESVQENEDAEDKKEEEEGGEDEDGEVDGDPEENDEIENEQVATEEEGLKKKRKGNEKTSFISKASSGKRRSGSQEPRQFWDDVLPQYLNLK